MTHRNHRPELLAPAGDAASLDAALAAGADAVYFGLDAGFNARARAANFRADNLKETVVRCHRAGARVFLTLNTLVFEGELTDVAGHVVRAAQAGVDALIVQDPAVALVAREVAPTLEIHASTQMTISSGEASRFAQDLGAVRVVVPRELSVDEVRRFAKESDVELEVFVHGALCVAWSGQCLTSEAWSGRSANRGQCAQSCRMPYDLVLDGDVRDLGDVKYLLSPKDMAGMRALDELSKIGVHGLKIEGRQKGPQYVAITTRAYRRRLDEVAAGRDVDTADAAEDVRDMTLAYSRGFSDGFLGGSDHQTLVEGRFPKHRGICVGRVAVVSVEERAVRVVPDASARPWTGGLALDDADDRDAPCGTPKAALSGWGGADDASVGPAPATLEVAPGMGVVFDDGDPEDKTEPGGPVFSVARRGKNDDELVLGFGRPGPDLGRVRVGQRVWVTSDPQLEKETRRLVARDPEGRLALRVVVTGVVGDLLRVTATTDRGEVVEVASRSTLDVARGRGLDADLAGEKLGALGGTPYRVETFVADDLATGLHLPVSELKALRREMATRLDEVVVARCHEVRDLAMPHEDVVADPEHDGGHEDDADPVTVLRDARRRSVTFATDPIETAPTVVPLCRTDDQLEAVIAAGLPEVELDWMELVGLRRAVARAREAGLRVTIASLRVQKPGEDGFGSALENNAPDAVLVRHWGALVRFREGGISGRRPRLHGDFSLNVTNSLTAWHLFDVGVETVTVSHDLNEAQLLDLLDNVPAERMTVVVQHRISTFHTEHCVYAHLLSEGRDYRTCGRPCEKHEVSLQDHLGQQHPVIVDAGCRNTVFDGEVQTAAGLVPKLIDRGVRRFRVEFVRETREEAARALAAWADILSGAAHPADLARRLGTREQVGVVGSRRG